MQHRPYSFWITLSLELLAAWFLVFLLVSNHSDFPADKAALITTGMSKAEVEEILGRSDSLAGCVFVPIQAPRENNELKVDAVKIVPSFYPLVPGLDAHTLHARQESEFYLCWGQHSADKCGFWLGRSCSLVVFFDQQGQVEKVFELPTTLEQGDFKTWLQWRISYWLNK